MMRACGADRTPLAGRPCKAAAPASAKPMRVLCAMSGGVDSSVAAKILLDQGYEVLGVTMVLLGSSESPSQEVKDAQQVCARLGIEHETVDFSHLFEEKVIEPFCAAYWQGLTPNPCIECNKHLKFEALQRLRAERGCDFVATGHYAQVLFNEHEGRFELHRAKDPKKDQSYVLYHLSQDHLAHTLFPLGGLTKDQVRALAAKAGFANAQKAESQDICFVPDGDYATFIERHDGRKAHPGAIVDDGGAVLGEHQGLLHYTIGQRKGLGVAVGEPLFVLSKDASSNELVVGTADKAALSSLVASEVVFPSHEAITNGHTYFAKINYRAKPRAVKAAYDGDVLQVVFEESIRAAAPGQACVLYEGDRVVAGGVICRTNPARSTN